MNTGIKNRFKIFFVFFPALGLLLFASSCKTTGKSDGREKLAVVLSNDVVNITVNPAYGGRLLAIQYGSDGENLLWENQNADKVMWNWENHGGEKTWPGPQEIWEDISGYAWPPPKTFDYMPYRVLTQTASTIVMRSSVDDDWRMYLDRTISISNDVVLVSSHFHKILPDDSMPANRVTNWSISQLPVPQKVYIKLMGKKRWGVSSDDHSELPVTVLIADESDIVVVDFAGYSLSGKTNFDSNIMAIPTDKGFFVIRQKNGIIEEPYHSAGPEQAQLYFSGLDDDVPRHSAYIEVEFCTDTPEQTIEFRFLTFSNDSDAEDQILNLLTEIAKDSD